MRRLRGLLCFVILLPLLIPVYGLSLSSDSGIKIVEIQTSGPDDATDQEFVEIFNTSDTKIDISEWKLQYRSASGSSWQTKTTLNGYIYPNGRILLSSKDYLTEFADISFNSGFKMEAGHVRIVKPDPYDDQKDIVEDLVGWGTALYPDGASADYAQAGMSMIRKTDDTGKYVDSDNNKDDFELSSAPSPESDNINTGINDEVDEEIVEEVAPIEDSQEEAEEFIEQESLLIERYPLVQITELLPNPAPPASDSTDEYIEIYNPNDSSVDLIDYKLQTGNSFSYSYTFDDTEIDPNSYMVFYITQTKLTLANTSGQARILDPNGEVIFVTDQYQDAKDGEVWVYANGVWQWSITPTPGLQNILALQSVLGTSTTATASKKKTTKKKAAKPKTAKKKAAKSTKAKKDKKDSQSAGATGANDDDGSSGGFSPQSWMIAGVGTIAVGYLLYEYKDDIRNKLLQFKRNRTIRRKAGATT